MANVVYLDGRRVQALEPIHRTTPRPGIYVAPPPHAHHRARRGRGPVIPVTGPVAHIHPYIANEERAANRQVLRALATLAVALLGAWMLVSALDAGVRTAVLHGWVTP